MQHCLYNIKMMHLVVDSFPVKDMSETCGNCLYTEWILFILTEVNRIIFCLCSTCILKILLQKELNKDRIALSTII